MDIFLFSTIFILFAVIYLIIGWWSSQKVVTTDGYFLANRNLGIASVTFTLVATQIGGGMLLGTAQQSYYVGLYGIFYTLGMAIGFIILGSGIAGKLQKLRATTTAELFETKYQSKILKKIASVLSIITLSGILVSQIVGARSLLLSIGFINEPLFILFWFFTIAYTMMGGLYAVVYTDIFQVLFIISLFGGVFVSALYGDFAGVLATFRAQPFFEVPEFGVSALMGTLLMPILFSLIEQDLAQRFFAAKNPFVAKISSFGAAISLLLFSLIPVYFGMKAQFLGLDINPGTSPLLPVLKTMVPEIIVIFCVIAIAAAIVSTADSLLCAISANIANDLELKLFAGNRLAQAKYITLGVGLVALCASYIVPQDIIGLIIESYEISVVCLLIPLLAVYFDWKKNTLAAFGGVFGGLCGFVLFKFIPPIIPSQLAALLMSGIWFYIGRVVGETKATSRK